MTIAFDHSYARDLPGTYLRVQPDPAPAPRLLVLNRPLARDLGLDLPVPTPSPRPMPGTSSAAFLPSLATAARIFWARW